VAAIFKRRTRIQSGKVISRNTILIRVACVSLALGLASAALTTPLASSVFNIIYSRTSTLQTDNRWGMYSDAMDKISERPIEGYGVATTVLAENFNLQIHNFILAAWFETGIVGMLLSIAVYAVLGFAWLRCMFSTKYTAEPGGPSLIWLCALPVLPLVRLMVAGEGGGVSVVEWLALAIFFAETGRLTNKNRAATNAYIASGPGASASPSIPGPAREIGIIPQTSS
jgi:O-antigen ligase